MISALRDLWGLFRVLYGFHTEVGALILKTRKSRTACLKKTLVTHYSLTLYAQGRTRCTNTHTHTLLDPKP